MGVSTRIRLPKKIEQYEKHVQKSALMILPVCPYIRDI